MSTIRLLVSAKVKTGKLDQLQAAAAHLAELATDHEGVQRYHFFLGEDSKTLHCVEEYRDEAALFGHMEKMGDALGPFLDALEDMDLRLFGNASDQLRGAFADYGAKHSAPIAGFSR